MIREQDTPAPSARLTTLGDKLVDISQSRRTDPIGLSKLMCGDLDSIVMKALDKNRDRRYVTANEFAADVKRFLAAEPVAARPPSRLYRLSKYAKRHRASVVTAAAICCLVIGAAVTSIGFGIQTHRARAAQRETSMELTGLHTLAGDFVAAEVELEKARWLGAPEGWYWLYRGQLALHQGKYAESRQHLRKAEASWPDSTAVTSLALICDRYAGYEQAYLLGVGKLNDRKAVSFEDFLFRGLAQTLAHPEQAIADLKTARTLKPHTKLVGLLMGNALRLSAADEVDPTTAQGKAELAVEETGVSRHDLPRNSFAVSEFIHANVLHANIYQRLGRDYDGKRAQSIERARIAVEQSKDMPYDHLLHLARVYFYDQLGSPESQAGELFDVASPSEGSNIHEHDIEVVFRRAWQKYREGDFVAALTEFDTTRGLFAHDTQLIFPAFIEMANTDDATALQAKYVPLIMQPDRDNQGIFAHHDWSVARLLDEKAVAQKLGKVFRDICNTLPIEIAAQHGPLADYMIGDIDNATAEARIRQLASSNRVLVEAFFALGVGRLAAGERSEAKRLFEASISTGYYEFFVYWWAKAFLEKLDDPNWLPWLPNDGSLSSALGSAGRHRPNPEGERVSITTCLIVGSP